MSNQIKRVRYEESTIQPKAHTKSTINATKLHLSSTEKAIRQMSDNVLAGINVNSASGQGSGKSKILSFLKGVDNESVIGWSHFFLWYFFPTPRTIHAHIPVQNILKIIFMLSSVTAQ